MYLKIEERFVFKRFPLLYIAWVYVFSTKDKIVFFMQQFACLIISLCIAVILSCFSVMNGFNQQIKDSILDKVAPIIIVPHITDTNDPKNAILAYNQGFKKFNIENQHITKVEYLRSQRTMFKVENALYQVMVYEDPLQIAPLAINSFTKNKLFINKQSNLILIDPSSYNGLVGSLSRFKKYSDIPPNDRTDDSYAFTVSSSEYQKLFHNDAYNIIYIYLKDVDQAPAIANEIKEQIPSFERNHVEVKSWQDLKPELFDAIKLQRKIFVLIYIILFSLLCAIIISTNVAFFKEKRKDWALYKILDVMPLSVERIFLYKNIISFIMSTSLGFIFGYLFTIYSNSIIDFIGQLMNIDTRFQTMFGTNKITYQFRLDDFLLISYFSFAIFFINFIILVWIFRRENVAQFLKVA